MNLHNRPPAITSRNWAFRFCRCSHSCVVGIELIYFKFFAISLGNICRFVSWLTGTARQDILWDRYRGGRSPHWVKVKNRTHPAMNRVRDAFS
jgi:hypothetical protein